MVIFHSYVSHYQRVERVAAYLMNRSLDPVIIVGGDIVEKRMGLLLVESTLLIWGVSEDWVYLKHWIRREIAFWGYPTFRQPQREVFGIRPMWTAPQQWFWFDLDSQAFLLKHCMKTELMDLNPAFRCNQPLDFWEIEDQRSEHRITSKRPATESSHVIHLSNTGRAKFEFFDWTFVDDKVGFIHPKLRGRFITGPKTLLRSIYLC